MISTHNLSSVPDIPNLRKLTQSLALLDAIICPEWEYRYYSFDAHWNNDLSVFFMRNGSGDEFIILFAKEGVVIKGFAHESVISPYRHNPPLIWPGVIDQLPKILASYLNNPAFPIFDTTFCIWGTLSDVQWRCGDIEYPNDESGDGSSALLYILDGNPLTYQKGAQEYYGEAYDISAISHIYQQLPLSESVVGKLNSSLSMVDIAEELKGIGYSS